jgi:ribonucleoside-diphosphate reductase alpha chain
MTKVPTRRKNTSYSLGINGKTLHLSVGQNPQGEVIEIATRYEKSGSTTRALLNAVSLLVSLLLQNGYPVEKIVDKLTFLKFEPAGVVQGHPRVKMCSSLLDLIFRVVGVDFLGRSDLGQIQDSTEV